MRHVLVACVLVASTLTADAFPDRPISFVVAQGPGGGSDRTARVLVQHMERHLPSSARLAVLNKPGAGGYVGYTEIALAKPDGHTIGLVNFPDVQVGPIVGNVRFNTESFAYLGAIGNEPTVVAALKSRFADLRGFLDEARNNPGKVAVGVPNVSNVHSIGVTKLAAAAGVSLNKVPLGDGGQAVNAVLGGHVDAVALSVSAIAPHRDRLVLLGQMAETRSPLLPEAPTFAEQGLAVTNSVYRVIAAPKNLPPATRRILADALKATVEDKGFAEQAEKQKMDVEYLGADQIAGAAERLDRELRELWRTSPWMKPE